MILITGCAGYIGSQLSYIFKKRKLNFIGLDNLKYSYRKNFPLKRNFFKLDISSNHINNLIKQNKIKTVIHCAALSYVMDAENNKQKYNLNNIVKTKKFIDMCKNNGVVNFVFFSSSNVYRNTGQIFSENTLRKPINIYGKNKLKIENYLIKKNFSSSVILRLFNIVGVVNKFHIFKPKKKYQRFFFKLIEKNFTGHNGSLDNIWFPVRRKDAEKQLKLFLKERLAQFGVYEDAMRADENFLYHSCLSPLLNIGLITPNEIVNSANKVFDEGLAPINSIEGFIRQIIGWREFIRGIYQLKGNQQKQSNFWGHKRTLKQSWYEGTTGITPLDDNIKITIRDGYNHHIPRLMVISNLMTLCQINPQNIFAWFMEMYIDSSDWVMVPNVFGMATYSDGGLMSTKPYTCSSNYILKMSNYKRGDWCDIVDGLYWRFIENHKDFYNSNPRLSFQLRLLDKMATERKERIYSLADNFLENHTIEN